MRISAQNTACSKRQMYTCIHHSVIHYEHTTSKSKAVEHLIHSTPVLEKRERHRQTDGQRQRDGDTKKKKKKKWKNERKKEVSDYTTLSSRGTIRFKQLRLKMLSGLASNSATSARKQNHVKKGQLVVKHSKCSAVCFVERKKM